MTNPTAPMPLAPNDAATSAIGAATLRIDARLKVTGGARYASDIDGGRQPAHGYLRTSAIARGRITRIDDSSARRVTGVLEILTFRNVGDRIKPGKVFLDQGYMGTSIAPLASDRIQHGGQIVALVVADSFEAARDAAQRIEIDYAEEQPSATFDSPGLTEGLANPKPEQGGQSGEENPKVGDAAGAFAAAPVKVDQRYETPTQHHNPIELFTTTCAWSGDELTVWESSRNLHGFKNGLAYQLGIPPEKVRFVAPFVGGAFGSRGLLMQRTAIVALAAKMVDRPVRLEATRSDGFTIETYRAETRHRLRLAAARDGKLQALIHEGWEISSRPDDYKVAGTDASTRLYACPNVDSDVTIMHADRNTPGFMRAPAEMPYLFALESAMDELAVELKMDPVELRRVNDTQVEPIKELRYTSRALMPCFDAAAEAFGWSEREADPGAMRDGDWLIGWGCASAMYPTQMGAAAARVVLSPQGRVSVQTATHEIGTGVMTAIALTAADWLGVPFEHVHVEVGDTRLPPAPITGGSITTATVCNVVAKACGEIRDRIARASTAPDAPFAGLDPATLRLTDGKLVAPDGRSQPIVAAMGCATGGAIEVYAENVPSRCPRQRVAGPVQGAGRGRRRRQAEGPHPVCVWRAIRRGSRPSVDPRGSRVARCRRLCRRPDHESQDGQEPVDGRPDLGYQRCASRGDRNRSSHRPLLQR